MRKRRTKQGGKYYLTRELARGIAKVNMKKGGIVRPCKQTGKKGQKKESWFSKNWREWAVAHIPAKYKKDILKGA